VGDTSNWRVVAFKVKVPGMILEWDRAKVIRWRHMSRTVALWLLWGVEGVAGVAKPEKLCSKP